jgi:hypothetical protein
MDPGSVNTPRNVNVTTDDPHTDGAISKPKSNVLKKILEVVSNFFEKIGVFKKGINSTKQANVSSIPPPSSPKTSTLNPSNAVESVKSVRKGKSVAQSIGNWIKKVIAGIFDLPDYLDSEKELDKGISDELKKILDTEDEEERELLFKGLFEKDKLKGKTKAELVHELLDSAEKIMRGHVEGHGLNSHNFVINRLREMFPEIGKYIVQNTYNQHQILTPEGVGFVINYLKKKGSLNEVPCHVCADYGAFEMKVQETIAHAKNVLEGQEPGVMSCTFILTSKNPPQGLGIPGLGDAHNTPVLLQRDTKGVWTAVISDSVGESGMYNGIAKMSLERAFKEAFKMDEPSPDLDIYNFNGCDRQTDSSNCPIFSIRDVVQFSKNAKEIVDWIKDNGNPEFYQPYQPDQPLDAPSKIKEYKFNTLPPYMMKTTQSFSAIQAYEGKNAEKLPSGNTVSESLTEKNHKVIAFDRDGTPSLDKNGQPKHQNFKVGGLFMKYQRMIYTKLITKVVETL